MIDYYEANQKTFELRALLERMVQANLDPKQFVKTYILEGVYGKPSPDDAHANCSYPDEIEEDLHYWAFNYKLSIAAR